MGKRTFLWQNTSGDRLDLANERRGSHRKRESGTVATAWSIVGGAHLDGDGDTDILWQNTIGCAPCGS